MIHLRRNGWHLTYKVAQNEPYAPGKCILRSNLKTAVIHWGRRGWHLVCTVNEEPTNVARYLIWLEQEVLVLVSKNQTGIRSDFHFQNRNQNFKEPDPIPGSQFSLGLEPEPRLLEKKSDHNSVFFSIQNFTTW